MTVVEYKGSADKRTITQAQLAAAGFAVAGGITWSRANNFRVQIEDPTLVAFLLAQGSTFQSEDEETFVGVLTSGANLMHIALAFDHTDAAALKAGMEMFVPEVGDILLDAWFEITTEFNGSMPKADIGQFVGTPDGLFGAHPNYALPVGLDSDGLVDIAGVKFNTQPTFLLASYGSPGHFVTTDPFKVIATLYPGGLNSPQIDSTVGEAVAHALILRPAG